jgi:thymidylate synthase (FAD)
MMDSNLNSQIYQSIPVLDHGYIRLIESWGSDERIIEAARMSTNKGFQGWGPSHAKDCQRPDLDFTECNGSCPISGDEKLLAYLYSHKHATPFEMAGLIIEVQAPIFVFREWHRHRTQSYNEMSARYTPLPDLNYIPTVERLMQTSLSNKQANTISGVEPLTLNGAELYREQLAEMYTNQEDLYQRVLRLGVPKELARVHLPVGRYSRMRASANLRNWLAFLTLRMDQNAQFEIRAYANVAGSIISQLFPRTWDLFAGSVK